MQRLQPIFWCVFLILFFTSPSYAQFSPGDLSSPHNHLSGLRNCTNCHVLGKGEKAVDQKCLDCHTTIAERVNAGEGYHARLKAQCIECHSEHNGANFNLIHWENGQSKFDHTQTGYILKGAHHQLKCEQCHTQEMISDSEVIAWESDHADRSKTPTFLGLPEQCLGCHEDYHQGQLDQHCESCHNEKKWKPVTKFDHDKTEFPLVGKHTDTQCTECHEAVNIIPGKDPTPRFADLEFRECSTCHDDVHKGSLGANCSQCHIPNDWKSIRKDQFDHNRTAYPLWGKHINVGCEKCHAPGESKKPLAHDQCIDCHDDYHAGQFAQRSTGISCEPCHSVYGFVPAQYSVDDHKRTAFPLTGAHAAQPCVACHESDAVNREIFRWDPLQCTSCHVDEHEGQFARKMKKGDCDICHRLSAWDDLKFDHEKTEFPLRGKHRQAQCTECHEPEDSDQPESPVQYVNLDITCSACHTDIHFGQFVQGGSQNAECEQCHSPAGWYQLSFEHDSMSRFSLKGKHVSVTCSECHPVETTPQGEEFVRYKPVGLECQDCHILSEIE